MEILTPESRPTAPGALLVVHALLNSAHLAGKGTISLEAASEIRLRHAAGENPATLANDYGVKQGFVAAVARGARLFDELATPESTRTWLVARGLLDETSGVNDEERRHLVDLRESLRALAAANNGQDLEPGLVISLNEAVAHIALKLQFGGPGNLELQPVGEGVDGAIGKLLAVVFEAMRDGTFTRLKRCPGDGCPHTFYDASRNRTGTWCAMSVCGNRTKVRNYQQRRRDETRRAPRKFSS